MVDFHIRQALQRFNRQNLNRPQVDVFQNVSQEATQGTTKNLINQMQSNIINNLQQQMMTPQLLRMNHLASVDRSVYIKTLLKLPDNMTDLLIMFAKNNADGKNLNQALVQNQQITQQAQGQIMHQQNLQNYIQQQMNQTGQSASQIQQQMQQQVQQQLQQGLIQQGQPGVNQNQPQIQPQVQPPFVPPNEQNNQSSQKPQNNNQGHNQNQNQNQPQETPNRPQLNNNQSQIFQQTLNNQVKHQLNMQAMINKNMATGGAANINNSNALSQNVLPGENSPQNSGLVPNHNPSSLQNRLNRQLLNHARFEPMANLQDSIRQQIRQPINAIPKSTPEIIQQEVAKELAQMENQALQQIAQKQVSAKVLPDSVNLSNLNSLLQKHSKQALNNLILEMSTASKQGITDTKPIQDTIGLINSSIFATSQNDTALAIKNLMLLYLPWLPLEEGVGFKLDVETKNSEAADDETSISIMITTKNYGNISAVINLITSNSVDIYITCSKAFPKSELLKRLNLDSKHHSMNTSIGVEEISQPEQIMPDVQKAKVNLSNVTTINPYLLLMSHSFIRHAIEIDINTTMYGQAVQQ